MTKDKILMKMQADHQERLLQYELQIKRLEENNREKLEEIIELREMLKLHAGGIDLQMEASGAWDDIEEARPVNCLVSNLSNIFTI